MLSLPSIQNIVKEYDLAAKKSFGQNFLFDLNLTSKIVRAAGSLKDCTVIEVGPGPGALTRSILQSDVKQVFAIEMDKRCIEALEDYLVPASDGRLKIIEDDALKNKLYNEISGKIKIIANLPYNISTELLFKWLDDANKFESMTLMFQKEVAMRICAKPRTKSYGRVSIKTQWLCDVEKLFDISPKAFFPPPKVTSSIVKIIPRTKPLYEADEKDLDIICKAAFGQRRKTLRASLKQITKDPLALLKEAGIDDNRRPEELSISEFCSLARTYRKLVADIL